MLSRLINISSLTLKQYKIVIPFYQLYTNNTTDKYTYTSVHDDSKVGQNQENDNLDSHIKSKNIIPDSISKPINDVIKPINENVIKPINENIVKPISEYINTKYHEHEFYTGKFIPVQDGNHGFKMAVKLMINDHNNEEIFNLAASSKYSHITIDDAKKLNLKGHPKMISKCTLTGADQYRYLIPITFKIDKFEYPLVINMSTNQLPKTGNYIGKDLIMLSGMRSNFEKYEFKVTPYNDEIFDQSDILKLHNILKHFNLKEENLVPISQLPPEITNQEYKKNAIHLGK